jgi:Rha family phage regulatory protein
MGYYYNLFKMTYEKKSAAHTLNEQIVFIQTDKPITTSRLIAKTFEKRHDNVLRDIEILGCSNGFRLLNFEESTYKNEQNKNQPEYLITKDGFTMLAFGYTGDKAMQFKESYIERFNAMEMQLQKNYIANQALLSSYNNVQQLINQCYAFVEDNYTWYAASQLRLLSGKSSTGGYQRKAKLMGMEAKMKKVPYRGQLCWFVRHDAVNEILSVKQNHITAVAMVNLLQKPQAAQMQMAFGNTQGGSHA